MNKNDREYLVQKIRSRYTEREETELDALKKLDKKAKAPVNVFAYTFGSAAALIMGAGMSLIMTDIGKSIGLAEPMPYGLVIGLVGMTMAILNHPIYKKMMTARRKKYAEQIITLSDNITKAGSME